MSFMKMANKFLLFGAMLAAGPALAVPSVTGQCHFNNAKSCDVDFVFCAPTPAASDDAVETTQLCVPRMTVTCGKHEIFDNDYEVEAINDSVRFSGITNFGKPIAMTVHRPTSLPATVPASLQIGFKTLAGSCFIRRFFNNIDMD